MPYLTELVPDYGQPAKVAPGVIRIVARNPSLMTYHGTNTYIMDCAGEIVILDPGPDNHEHVEAVLRHVSGRITAILLTHYHNDHAGAVRRLQTETEAPLYGYRPRDADAVMPDHELRHGDMICGMQVIHTPGHAADHICFARTDHVLFSGDHVMSWSSSIVSPPHGNMADYVASLRLLLDRDDILFLPGHGPPLPHPASYVEELLHHRAAREAEILNMLHARSAEPPQIVKALYAKRDPRLFKAAERNVIAHLAKLEEEGRVRHTSEGWRSVIDSKHPAMVVVTRP